MHIKFLAIIKIINIIILIIFNKIIMSKVNTTIRLEESIKNQSMQLASELWISLNSVISLYLKNNFLKKKWIDFSIRDDAWFTREAWNDLKTIRAESQKWKNISKPYWNLQNLLSDLKNDAVNYN